MKKMKMKKQTREINLSIDNIDTSENTVLLAFSSEQPVTRTINGQDYNEILLHGVDNVDMSRLNNKAALLFNHDFDKHIGIIESASIDSDKVGRAIVRFSSVGMGAEKYQMVVEKTLTKVSVGYEVLDYTIDGENLLVNKWFPYEISMVSVPADDYVGIGRGRSEDDQEEDEFNLLVAKYREEVEELIREQEEETIEEVVVDDEEERNEEEDEFNLLVAKYRDQIDELIREQEEDESTESEVQEEVRVEEIEAISRTLKISNAIRDKAIKDGTSVAAFKRRISRNNNKNIKDDKTMTNKFSLNDAIRSILDGKTSTFSQGKNGVEIPFDAFERALRAGGVNTTNAKGVISNEILYGSFVDVLRANSILANFPIQLFTGLSAEISIPKLGSDFTTAFGFIAEDGESPEHSANFEAIKLAPKTFTGSVPLTRTVLKSCPQIEQIVSQSIVAGSAERLEALIMKAVVDAAIAAGNVTNVSAYDYASMVEAQGKLGDVGVNFGNIAAVMSPSTKATLRNTLRGENTAAVYLLDDGDLCGVPAYDSKVLAGQGEFVILGDFSNIAIGEWGSLELDLDDTTNRNKGSVIARVWADIDFKLTRPEAFQVIRIQE
ncbi:phage major capsid protein [Yersinia kristensenii]|uniref:phage major capsid protein n=1 Tax=Yersinia kristensenii TaxID=28152 RepID=UPI001562AE96|nr:phage major capsid protein [Yersinia kristensenii]QKJ15574.1 phage major capsid protein [Yersinia kristensenii]